MKKSKKRKKIVDFNLNISKIVQHGDHHPPKGTGIIEEYLKKKKEKEDYSKS